MIDLPPLLLTEQVARLPTSARLTNHLCGLRINYYPNKFIMQTIVREYMMLFKPVNIALFNRDNRHNFGMIIVIYCPKSLQEGA
jgi:hypothetical protein